MFYSDNYGQYGSWVFRTSEGSYSLASGRIEGEIFKGPGMSSNDYGYTFTQHSLNGCFCSLKAFEIGDQDSTGYVLGDIYGINDTLWLLKTNDNFENLEIQHIFNWISCNSYFLSRGTEPGELYLLRFISTGDGSKIRELWYSSNFGENWIFKNNLISQNIVGGRQPGEMYVLANYVQLMGEIKHTYIYHSLDYGETFAVYHPFSHGPVPYFANFEAEPTTGTAPLTVQFIDLSSGDDIQSWEWDFQNDGIVDSYEQNPTFTYQDTSYYSVKLKIQYGPLNDGFIKANYIHVTENNSSNEEQVQISKTQLSNYPNPFNPSTIINYNLPMHIEKTNIEIYNLKGQLVDEIAINSQHTSVSWHAEDFSSGIYIYKLNIKNSLINKMILLK
ncbi:MAG: PKD domain-containing protein [Candidatus Cloacimonetes bacterium]|nr:PKD domain-containing protein [Candidatus Cloacimonadota bacterium]